MKRQVINKIKGFKTQDGAGVHLVRVLGNDTVYEYDPILMLDSFDSTNPKDYTAGFPMHPHRGIETISYIYSGSMIHKDSLGNEDTISDGEVQWMTAGSGIFHEEKLPACDRMLGVQLWLNLPAKDKMVSPQYHSIKNSQIQEIQIPSGKIRLLAGDYENYQGYKSKHLPFDYYDIHLDANSTLDIKVNPENSVMVFTLLGQVIVGDTLIEEKTAGKLSQGDTVTIKTTNTPVQLLFMSSKKLDEPIVWGGPIVMNTKKELDNTFLELQNNTFLKTKIEY